MRKRPCLFACKFGKWDPIMVTSCQVEMRVVLTRILRPGGIRAKERTHMRAVHKHTYMQTQALFSGVLMFNSVNLYVQT